MTDRTIDAKDWNARQPKTVQEAGEARGEDQGGATPKANHGRDCTVAACQPK